MTIILASPSLFHGADLQLEKDHFRYSTEFLVCGYSSKSLDSKRNCISTRPFKIDKLLCRKYDVIHQANEDVLHFEQKYVQVKIRKDKKIRTQNKNPKNLSRFNKN